MNENEYLKSQLSRCTMDNAMNDVRRPFIFVFIIVQFTVHAIAFKLQINEKNSIRLAFVRKESNEFNIPFLFVCLSAAK